MCLFVTCASLFPRFIVDSLPQPRSLLPSWRRHPQTARPRSACLHSLLFRSRSNIDVCVGVGDCDLICGAVGAILLAGQFDWTSASSDTHAHVGEEDDVEDDEEDPEDEDAEEDAEDAEADRGGEADA